MTFKAKYKTKTGAEEWRTMRNKVLRDASKEAQGIADHYGWTLVMVMEKW